MTLELSRQNLEKYSNVKFYEHSLIESRVVPRGGTDRHGEANGRFSQLSESASTNRRIKPKERKKTQ